MSQFQDLIRSSASGTGLSGATMRSASVTYSLHETFGHETTTLVSVAHIVWQLLVRCPSIHGQLLAGVNWLPGDRADRPIVVADEHHDQFDLLVLMPESRQTDTPTLSTTLDVDAISSNEWIWALDGFFAEHTRRVRKLVGKSTVRVLAEQYNLVQVLKKRRDEIMTLLDGLSSARVCLKQVPPGVLTACPTPACGVRVAGAQVSCTLGALVQREDGTDGAVTALHGVEPGRSKAKAEGLSVEVDLHGTTVKGVVRVADPVTDSVFIEFDDSPPTLSTSLGHAGVLTASGPGQGSTLTFDGVKSGRTTVQLAHSDLGIPFVSPGKQLRIYTDPQTNAGDSGAGLVDNNDQIVGFCFDRSPPGAFPAYSSWIWANSTFDALDLVV